MSRSNRFGPAFLDSVRDGPTATPDAAPADPTPTGRGKRARTTKRASTPTRASQVTPAPATPASDPLRRPPRGQGRHGPGRTEQLNVRLTPRLKRLAAVRAAREGVTVGDLVERLLLAHLQANGELDRNEELPE
ncbi:hypothetical protein [Deinococcus pimensis]|uniref:hypothetical protein n=1 Tax=Deinococcus pimensis TaxID=309888 RepID=UPI000481CA9A|nr:hypothetical protein [Deinococcus pimensis]